MIVDVIVAVWSAFFVQKQHGGLVLILMSILLLLTVPVDAWDFDGIEGNTDRALGMFCGY